MPPRSRAPSAARPAERLGRSGLLPGPPPGRVSAAPRNPELGAEARCSWAPSGQEAQPRDRTVRWSPGPSRIPPEPAASTEALWAPWLQSSLEAEEVSGRPERLGLWRLRPLNCVSTARGAQAPTRPWRLAGFPARGPAAHAGAVVRAARPARPLCSRLRGPRGGKSSLGKLQIRQPAVLGRFGDESGRCEISFWRAGEKEGAVYEDQLSPGQALDIRQEKIFAFVFYKLPRKQTSTKRLDCISST